MISSFLNRQGFGKSLSGIDGSAVQSVYVKPVIEPALQPFNVSLAYPLGNPWGWGIFPWNWGKEGKGESGEVSPSAPPEDSQDSIAENPFGNVLMFFAVIGGAWFLINYKR